MCTAGSSVVACTECGTLLTYPTTLRVTLVSTPYGHPTPSHKKKKKGRKQKSERKFNKGELDQQKHHDQIVSWLSGCYNSLSALGHSTGHFPVTTIHSSEHTPHSHVKDEVDLVSMCKLDALVPCQEPVSCPYILTGDEDNVELFGHVISNKESCDVTMSALGARFTVPAQCSFLLSDVTKIRSLESLHPPHSYSLLVLDPPWENRSAIRGKKYSWLSNEQLLDLPLPGLLREGAVVAVWVTNKRSIAQFVRERLFPHWGVQCQGEWHWIKVTTGGELVWPMDSAHKKPYETLLIGRVNSVDFPGDGQESSGEPPGDERESPGEPPVKRSRVDTIPSQYAIMAVPSTTHSQKPYLGDLLGRWAPEGNRLELFARNLLPGWTSWGNEVLKFQQVQRETTERIDSDSTFK